MNSCEIMIDDTIRNAFVSAGESALNATASIGGVYPTNMHSQSWISIKTEKMPTGAKSQIFRNAPGYLCVNIADKSGYVDRVKSVMYDINDVQVINREYKSQVIVTFADGSSEKATLSHHDDFNLEQGISICVTKKLLSMLVGKDFGSSIYNKIIDRGVKVARKRELEKIKLEQEEEAKKARYEKLAAKKRAKRLKREAAAREELIEIQKEAYLRAMREFNIVSAD